MSNKNFKTISYFVYSLLVNGDATIEIEKIPDESIDLIFADFPFKLKLQQHKKLAEHFYRVLKPTGNLVMINNPTNFFKIFQFYAKFHFRNEIVLIKPYKFVPFKKRLFSFKHNKIVWLVKDKKQYKFHFKNYTDVWNDVYYMVKGSNIGSIPYEVCKRVVECFTDIGDVVLDVFAGYGTMLKVCDDMKRNYIGFEIDKENFLKARRIELKNLISVKYLNFNL